MLPTWASLAATLLQAGDGADGAPPIVGWGAQLTFFAFLIVMLVVPWIMARRPPDRASVRASGPSGDADRSLFSSDHERRLWLWTVAVLVAIYATLSPAQTLAMALRERNLLGVSTAVFLSVVAAVILAFWARRHPGPREIGAAIGVAAVYVTTVIRLPVPEARSHLFEYGLLGLLVYHALNERSRNGRRVPFPAVLALVATVLMGWIDEGIQFFLPTRVFDWVDVGFNALAATLAILAAVFLGWARSWDLFKRRRT